MNYLLYLSSVTLRIDQGHKALALSYHNRPRAQSPHRLSNCIKERQAMSAYRGRVGQRAVKALTWRHHHRVIIGAPTFGESSGVRQSVLGALRGSVHYPHNVSVEDMHHHVTREGSSGFRCSRGPGLLRVLGVSVIRRSKPISRIGVEIKGMS